jgi:hypothetical protein
VAKTLAQVLVPDALARDPLRRPHRELRRLVKRAGGDEARTLYAYFGEFNRRYFGGKLGDPMILISPPSSPRAEGSYSKRDAHGLQSRILIAPATMRRGMRVALACLLHEMVHAWCWEVLLDEEPGYKGHGPLFAAKCNEIGAQLGVPEVAPKGRNHKARAEDWPELPRIEGEDLRPARKPRRGPEGQQGERRDPDGGEGDSGDGGRRLNDTLAAAIKRAREEECDLICTFIHERARVMKTQKRPKEAETVLQLWRDITSMLYRSPDSPD